MILISLIRPFKGIINPFKELLAFVVICMSIASCKSHTRYIYYETYSKHTDSDSTLIQYRLDKIHNSDGNRVLLIKRYEISSNSVWAYKEKIQQRVENGILWQYAGYDRYCPYLSQVPGDTVRWRNPLYPCNNVLSYWLKFPEKESGHEILRYKTYYYLNDDSLLEIPFTSDYDAEYLLLYREYIDGRADCLLGESEDWKYSYCLIRSDKRVSSKEVPLAVRLKLMFSSDTVRIYQ